MDLEHLQNSKKRTISQDLLSKTSLIENYADLV